LFKPGDKPLLFKFGTAFHQNKRESRTYSFFAQNTTFSPLLSTESPYSSYKAQWYLFQMISQTYYYLSFSGWFCSSPHIIQVVISGPSYMLAKLLHIFQLWAHCGIPCTFLLIISIFYSCLLPSQSLLLFYTF
jgi:hypothetical protein